MKKSLFVASLVFCLFVLNFGGHAAESYLLARFRVPVQQDREFYKPGGVADELTTCTYFQRYWGPVGPSLGWLTNQFKSPDIATPPVPGPEGDNALYGNSNAADSTREGYWIQLENPISGSFTFEVFFYLDELNPSYAEYKMQNIVSSFWMSDAKAVELRYFGTTSPYNTGCIQLMTDDGTAPPTNEHNVTSGPGLITADKWYYAAVVYDHGASEISFYLADASDPENITPTLIGTANPNWASFTMQWLCLAAWPNPAGSCRDITGYIDAFGLSGEALSPSNFLLLYLPALPTNVKGLWNLYE
jgi:hypothetical protein